MTAIVIDTITIRQDGEGCFNLNDLHQAAGGKPRHKPWQFLALNTTKELCQSIKLKAGIPAIEPLNISRGRYGGTFVCKELVYEYAMWISPDFKLKVIRAYDRLATKGVAVHESAAEDLLKNPLKYMRELLGQAEKIKAERDGLVETVGQCQHTLGRFCVNDLHKAAGSAEKDKPIKWLHSEAAASLIPELRKGQICPISTQLGRSGNT